MVTASRRTVKSCIPLLLGFERSEGIGHPSSPRYGVHALTAQSGSRSRLGNVRDESGTGSSGGRLGRLLAKALYWGAVLVISLVLLVGLILLLESRDDSSVSAAVIAALPL